MDRVSEIEIKYVKEVLSKQFRTSSGGIMMKRFEDAFAKGLDRNLVFHLSMVQQQCMHHLKL